MKIPKDVRAKMVALKKERGHRKGRATWAEKATSLLWSHRKLRDHKFRRYEKSTIYAEWTIVDVCIWKGGKIVRRSVETSGPASYICVFCGHDNGPRSKMENEWCEECKGL